MTGGGEASPQELVPEGLVPAIRDALCDDLVGLYLYGSAVAGGFDEGISDIDLIAVTRRAGTALNLARLGAMHAAFEEEHPDWADRIEVAYVGVDDLRAFRTRRSLAVISP